MHPARRFASSITDPWSEHPNELLRLIPRDKPARQVLAIALKQGQLPIGPAGDRPTPAGLDDDDYTLIDPALAVKRPKHAPTPPPVGVGYAGLTSEQRGFFAQWLEDPSQEAPPAYRQLYLAHVETRLFEGNRARAAAVAECTRLLDETAWKQDRHLGRVALLAGWLIQDGTLIARTVAAGAVAGPMLGIALGLQATLQTPLLPDQAPVLSREWRVGAANRLVLDMDVVRMRLESMANVYKPETLAYALAQVPEDEYALRPWRSVHRDLRLALPQPDVRPYLEPILADFLASETIPTQQAGRDLNSQDLDSVRAEDEQEWLLTVEFGESRSQYFDYLLHQAQKASGYQQFMDEDRRIVHRVTFRKKELRRFWRIWEYIQNWSSTKVYLNGAELEKWKIWPYSQYLR